VPRARQLRTASGLVVDDIVGRARLDHPLPLGEGRGEGTAQSIERSCDRGYGTYTLSACRFRGNFTLTPKPEESPRIIMGRRSGPSSPLSLRERGLGVRVKTSEAGHCVPEESRVRGSVRPALQYPHPTLSRWERVVYASDRSCRFFRGDSSAPTPLSRRERGAQPLRASRLARCARVLPEVTLMFHSPLWGGQH
jgi:hypothetical protein